MLRALLHYRRSITRLALASFFVTLPAPRTSVEPRLLQGLVWRNIGPFRGGRISAVTGAIGQPGTFYAGYPAAGVWKTTSAGETWYPIFDSIKSVSSVGSVEVAPSDVNVVYVGTGDQVTGGTVNEGDGMYKSSDAGKTWQHIGLETTKQIPSILVDTRDPNVVLVAAQGDLHKKTDMRGVYRSTDGGRVWSKTLYVDDETGIQKLARADDVPATIFATTDRHYNPPPSTTVTPPRPPSDTGRTGTSVYKSSDGGITWRELSGGGLPRIAGRTSIAVAMHTNAQRVFLVSNSGLYRSDDGGTTWRQMAADDVRIRNGQSGYNCGVNVDPQNPDIVYTTHTAMYRSTDGGATFTGFKGAPGGDDPQQMWIDATNGQRMFIGWDQGATISLDGGGTWSSWYNQSTEQVYHISTDNSFPYWVYATQQDVGAIRQRSRGNYGAIGPFDWGSVNGWEWGTIVPDPLDDNTVYSTGNGVVRISYPSEQWINVSYAIDPAAKARTTSSSPILFAPWNRHELISGLNYIVATTDAGMHWHRLSGELGIPKGLDSAAAVNTVGGRGAIESLAASSIGAGTIWAGTNNGLIHVTRDEGKTWTDVSIPDLPNPRRALISSIDASPYDAGTAYVAVEYVRIGDFAPHLYRTREFGKSWTKIVEGLPTGEPSGSSTRVVRADPKKKGLLFAGTESGVHVSFDDGDHWQSLTLNLPNTSYRDITIKGNDLITGTYGRGIYILDDISVLRQLTPAVASEPAHLFAPGEAVRVRRNVSANTPFPVEVQRALNPPDGAIIYYSLASKPSGDITLDVSDSAGRLVRHMSSVAVAPVAEAARPPHPNFWVAPPTAMPTEVGLNRMNWDARHDAPQAFSHSFEINANPGLTPTSPEGALAAPGVYTLTLTVDGRRYTQRVTVRNDPRSPATPAALTAQHALLASITEGMNSAWSAYQQAQTVRTLLAKAASAGAPSEVAAASTTLTARIDSVLGSAGGRGGRGGGGSAGFPSSRGVNGALAGQLSAQENGDQAPTLAMRAAFASSCADLDKVLALWARVVATDIPAFNQIATRNGVQTVTVPGASARRMTCTR